VVGHRVFIALSNLLDTGEAAGPGLVVVVDAAAWTMDKIIELSSPVPVWIHRPVSGGSRLYVSCQSSNVEVLDTQNDEVVEVIDLGGGPARVWVGGDQTAWAANHTGISLKRFDTQTFAVLEPLKICPAGDLVFDVATDGRGRVYATCPTSNTVQTFTIEGGAENAVGLQAGQQPGALLVIQR
jgi:YVTN family beta-propeller protein